MRVVVQEEGGVPTEIGWRSATYGRRFINVWVTGTQSPTFSPSEANQIDDVLRTLATRMAYGRSITYGLPAEFTELSP